MTFTHTCGPRLSAFAWLRRTRRSASRGGRFSAVFVVLLLMLPATALAQDAQAQGPLVIERVRNPFVVAPDYKVTDVDGDFGQLAGVYAGVSIQNTLFIGGAGYWLVNGSESNKLAYGGLLAGWSMAAGRRIRFGARSLVGIGSATLGSDFEVTRGFDGGRGIDGPGGIGGRPGDNRGAARFGTSGTTRADAIRIRARDDFFVFEPQADVLTRVTDHIGLHWAGGYRLTALADALDDRVNGPIGSVALQLEW